jgi:hypothetical protein
VAGIERADGVNIGSQRHLAQSRKDAKKGFLIGSCFAVLCGSAALRETAFPEL